MYVANLEGARKFFTEFFGATSNELYHNPRTGLRTYFLTFPDGGRLEIISRPEVDVEDNPVCRSGFIHLSFCLGSREEVDRMTSIRTGSGDRLATESELSAMYREQSFAVRSEMPITDSSMDLLDMPALRSYRAQVAQHNPSYVPQNMLMEDFCYQIGAMNRKGELTYGGLLMLGQRKHIDHEVPTFWMDYIEVPGRNVEEAPTRYTFRIEPQENLWQYYRALLPRLRLFCDNAFHLNADGVAVDDLSQFECMRECLANACMHTDYFSPLHSCIRAYTNRIEFLNAGSFAVPLQTGEQSYQMI